MPKIKVKNIPSSTQRRVCQTVAGCCACSFLKVIGDDWICIFDDNNNDSTKENTVIDIDESYFPTNREWLESLSDEDLAGVIACRPSPAYTGLYGMPVSMVKKWLSQPCEYLMEKE